MKLAGPPYDPEPCRVWIATHIKQKKVSTDDEDVKLRRRRDLWQIRSLRTQARARKLAFDQARGQLIEVALARQWTIEKFLRIKQRLEKFPDELQVLMPEDVRPLFRADLQKAIRSLLLEMAGWKLQPEKEPSK